MKKFLIIAVAFSMLFAFNTPAMAFLDDNSTNADASVADVTASINTVNKAADLNDGRQFANPGSVGYGPVLNYFGQPLPSEGFQPVEQLLMYSSWFTEGALESMLKGVEDAEAEFKVANVNIAAAKLAGDDATKWIMVVISREKYVGADVGFKGFITARSDDKRTTMVEVMAKAALTAVKNGCNVIHFTAQGAVRDVMASGWGIGFNTTQATLMGGSDNSGGNVSSGGMGYSSARAGTRDLPWLQGFGLVDNDLTYPAINK